METTNYHMSSLTSSLSIAVVLACCIAPDVGAQTTWTGAVSSAWADAGNWSAGVPANTTDVVIAPSANAPSTSGGGPYNCLSLTVQAGASIAVLPGTALNVWGDVACAGLVAGSVRMRASAQISTSGAGQLGHITLVAGDCHLVDVVAQSLNQEATAGLLTVDHAVMQENAFLRGGGLVGSSGSLLQVGGVLNLGTIAAVTVPPETIRIGSRWISDASWQPTLGLVEFDGPLGTNATVAAGTRFHDFTVSSPQGHVFFGDLLVDGLLRMASNVEVTGTAIDLGQRAGLNLNVVLVGPNVTTLRLRDGIVSAGQILLPNAVMDADGSLQFFVSGTLSLGDGVHVVSGNFNHAGIIQAPATAEFEFDGVGALTTTANGLLPNVRLTGAGHTIYEMRVLGDFEQSFASGPIQVEQLIVGGNARFLGQSVSGLNGGIVQVGGDFDWQTFSVVSVPPSLISVAGRFTATPSFQPSAGRVVLNGNGLQVVTRPAFAWHDLEVGPNSQVSTTLAVQASGSLTVAGTLTTGGLDIEVQGPFEVTGNMVAASASRVRAHSGAVVTGQLTAPVARLDLDGDLELSGGMQLGVGGHEASGSLFVSGSLGLPAGQELVLDGSGIVDIAASNAVPAVRLTGTDYEVRSLQVAGGLLQQAGSMSVLACTVGGDAVFNGIDVTDEGGGLLDVHGSVQVSVSGLLTSPPAVWKCGGDWTSDASFAPQSGIVELNAVGPQNVTMPIFQWHDLRIVSGSIVSTAQDATTLGFLDVGGQLVIGGGSLQVSGDLSIGSAGLLQASVASTVIFNGEASILGTLDVAQGALNAGGDVSVPVGGAVLLGNGPHELQGSLSVQGSWSVPVGEETRFLGVGDIDLSSGVVLPVVVIGGAGYSITRLTVQDELRHINGRLQVADLVSLGDVTFAGITVENLGSGLVDAAGDVVFATSNIVVDPPSLVRCGSNWSSNALFLPTAGRIEFVGGVTHSMVAPQLQLGSLYVAAGDSVTVSTLDVILQQDLELDGSFAAPDGLLEIRGDLTVGTTGQLAMTALGFCDVAGSARNDGSILGINPIRMVGSGVVSGAGGFPGLVVDTSGTILCQGILALAGDLVMETGQFSWQAAARCDVAGDWQARGGSIEAAAGGILEVQGSAILSNLAASTAGVPDIIVQGDWQADLSFHPLAGTVTLAGSSVIRADGGVLAFADLVLSGGSHAIDAAMAVDAQAVLIENPADLVVGAQRLDLTASSVLVSGQLLLGAGGVLHLGAGTDMEVSTTGGLSLLGAWDNPAAVEGVVGSGYSLTVRGGIEAFNYVFSGMGPGGVWITESATIASAPRDMRGGLFRDGDPAAGSCLLHIDRALPQQLRYIGFEDAGTVSYNVRSSGAAVVTIVNDRGNFTGVAHEDDPGSVIEWLPEERTELVAFASRAAVHRVEVAFETSSEVDVDRFQILRSQSTAGPFVTVAGGSLLPSGAVQQGSAYGFTDTFVVDTIRYYYRLQEVLTHGEPRTLGEDFARPWPQQIGNTWFVSAQGGYPDIASAVAAAQPGGTVVVESGTYAAFTVDKPIRILPDGSGPVTIDTSAASLVVRDVPAGAGDVVLQDLVVGSATAPFGMTVDNCDNRVLLDGLQVAAGVGVPGLVVADSRLTAVQRCDFVGEPGLRYDAGAAGYFSASTVDDLEVVGISDVVACDVVVGGQLTKGVGSSLTLQPGTMPTLQTTGGWVGDKPVEVEVATNPGSFFAMVYSLRRDFADLTAVFPLDMVLLVEQTQSVSVLSGLMGPSGRLQSQLVAPGGAPGWGLSIPLQVLELRLDGTGRLGTSRDLVFLP